MVGRDEKKESDPDFFYILFFFSAAAGRLVAVRAPSACRPGLGILCLPFGKGVHLFSSSQSGLVLFVEVAELGDAWKVVDDWVDRSFATCPVIQTCHYPFGHQSDPAIDHRSHCWPGR